MAAEAEIARLAGEGKQDIVPTGIAVDAREAVVRIAAFENAVDDLVLHRGRARVPRPPSPAHAGAPGARRQWVATSVHRVCALLYNADKEAFNSS